MKLFCPMCKEIKEREDIKTHFMEYLKAVQGNNTSKSGREDYNGLSAISTVYKVFKDIKELQVVQPTPNLGRKYQKTQ